jgi:hypothetical protein
MGHDPTQGLAFASVADNIHCSLLLEREYGTVLLTQYTKCTTILAVCAHLAFGITANAESSIQSAENAVDKSALSQAILDSAESANSTPTILDGAESANSTPTILDGAKSSTPAISDAKSEKPAVAYAKSVAPAVSEAELLGLPAISDAKSDKTGVTDPDSAKPTLIAQASCATCGTELNALSLMEGTTTKHKDKSILTDSLWGNLILEMAYQRDKGLQKLAKRMNLVNFATMASIGTIATGTLAQGIIALKSLNPQPGFEDSYTPGILGITLSSATLMTFVARMYFSRKIQVEVRDRQLALKKRVETVLFHLEHSHADCADAQKELTELIGQRACHEWTQLWQSSHQLAMNTSPRISLDAKGEKANISALSKDEKTRSPQISLAQP